MKIRTKRSVSVIAALSASAVLGASIAHAQPLQMPPHQQPSRQLAQQQTPPTDQQRQSERDKTDRVDPTQSRPMDRDKDSLGTPTGQSGTTDQTGQSQAGYNQAESRFITEALTSGRSEIATVRLAQERASNKDVKAFARELEHDHTQLNSRLEALQRSGPDNTSAAAHSGSTARPAQTGTAARTGMTSAPGATGTSGTAGQAGMAGQSGATGSAGINAKAPGQPGSSGAMGEGAAVSSANAGMGRELQELSAKSGAEFDKAFLAMQIRHHQESILKFEAAANRVGATASSTDADSAAGVAREALPVLRRHAARAQELSQQLGSS